MKDLLNFHNPLQPTEPFLFSNETKIGELSLKKDAKTSVFLTKSWCVFETKKSIDWIETDAYGTSKYLVSEKEEIKCSNMKKRYKND